MDDSTRCRLEALCDQMLEETHDLSTLIDAESQSTQEIVAAHQRVTAIADRYRALLAGIPENERPAVERTEGRRVTDLRRLVARLPELAPGWVAPKCSDGSWAQVSRAEPPSSGQPSRPQAAPQVTPARLRVGGEVEAWCGPCGRLTTSAIVAIVDGQPKQVICGSCNARHGFRTGPTRKRQAVVAAAPKPTKPTREQLEARRRQEERQALLKELAEADVVRPFSKRERYKVGEIVVHPEWGRGKVDTLMRGAILVSFRDAQRVLSLY